MSQCFYTQSIECLGSLFAQVDEVACDSDSGDGKRVNLPRYVSCCACFRKWRWRAIVVRDEGGEWVKEMRKGKRWSQWQWTNE